LATLSTSLSVLTPSEASFSSQRSWASPFRAFLLFGDRMSRSQPTLSSLRSPAKPLGLTPALRRIQPTEKAVPLFATRRVSPGQGHMLSWDLWASQALSPESTPQRASPSSRSPLTLRYQRLLNLRFLRSQGFRSFPAQHLPRKGAGLLDLSDPEKTILFESESVAAYFFSSRTPNSLRSPDDSLFATKPKLS